MTLALAVIIAILSGVVYVALGWGIAWVIDFALVDVDVSYTVFVVVALVLWAINVLAVVLQGVLFKRFEKKWLE